MARVLLVVATLAVTIYAVADVARTPNDDLPWRLPKALWILLALLLMPIGGIAWIIVSRVHQAENNEGTLGKTFWSHRGDSAIHFESSGGGQPSQQRRLAPDDDPDFLFKLEREIRRRRAEERDDGTKPAGEANDEAAADGADLDDSSPDDDEAPEQ